MLMLLTMTWRHLDLKKKNAAVLVAVVCCCCCSWSKSCRSCGCWCRNRCNDCSNLPPHDRHQSGSMSRESTCKVVLTFFNERAKATTRSSPIWFNVKREHLQRDIANQCTGQSRASPNLLVKIELLQSRINAP